MANVYAGQYGPEAMEYLDGGHAIMQPFMILKGDSGSDLAVLYSDRNRTETLSNPVLSDKYGNLHFWAEPGRYRLLSGNVQVGIVVNDDPDEPNADLTEEQMSTIAGNAADDVLGQLEPPVDLTVWFDNQLS